MLDTFWIYIIPLMMNVYNMILIKSYVESMPEELFEAAKIDGANDLTIFFRMVMPLAKPILMTVALFVAINQWNSWFDAYLYTSSQSLKPMQSILDVYKRQLYNTLKCPQMQGKNGGFYRKS